MSEAAKSFPFVVSESTSLLILGTMPGVLSLLNQQYYAHPRNAFWKIIFAVYGLEPENSYEQRLEFLLTKNLGLWDTLKHCERKGSLDTDIKNEYPNDFKTLFAQYPNIKRIAFNGKGAHKFFEKYIGFDTGRNYFILPSTSPANASKNFENKLIDWKKVLLDK